MKHETGCWIALAAAIGLGYAAGTPGATPDRNPDPSGAQSRNATQGTSGNVMAGSSGSLIAPYCAVSYVQGVHPISHVRGMGIDNISDPMPNASPSLEDFTGLIGQVMAGEHVNISVRGYTAGDLAEGVKVYIDWNQDGIFDDATEGYLIGYLRYSTGTDSKQVQASIRVPDSARTGETRMRVIKAFDLMANPWSCNEGNSPWGQAEDYTLHVDGVESEELFCNGFEQNEGDSCGPPPQTGIVYSGPLNVTIPPDGNGLTVNFVTGETSSISLPISHFNVSKGDPYLYGPVMFFFWGSDVNNAGVVLDSQGPYLVLGAGDTIGPSSTFSRDSLSNISVMFPYMAGVNGYLGVRFMNEETGEINYGYVHMLTTSSSGFPAMILDYAYDPSGAAITIP